MTQNGLSCLERYWRSPSLNVALRSTLCWLRTQQHPNALCTTHNRGTGLSISQCRHSSHIVKSPFKDIEIPKKLITEVVWETVDKFPDNTAVKCGLSGRTYTFAEIQKLSYRFANALRQAGFVKGEVISVVLPNCPEFPIITLGALEAELSISYINHVYTADEICHQLKDSGSVCLVGATENLDTIMKAVRKVEEQTQSKRLRRIIAVDIPTPVNMPGGVVRLTEMIGSNIDASAKTTLGVEVGDLAFLPYSSGTTGLPKGVCLSHSNIVSNMVQFNSIEGVGLRSPREGQDILLGLLPFYHIYGLVVILLSSLIQGSQVITLPKFEQDSLVKSLEKEKFTGLMLVPPLILFLGHSDKIQPKHLAHLRFLVSGAAPLGASDMERVKHKLSPGNNCIVQQAYGMTETSPVATAPPLPAKNMATIGVPIANTFAKVINSDGEALGVNESGELCIKGPQVMLGYHNNPKATADMIDSEGWLRTGDMAYFDEDNHFYIKDRLKELIKVKGLQVAPAELEEVLRSHPAVSDAGVIGVPCPRSGETPVAYIVVKRDKKLAADDVKNFLSEKVSRHKQVSEVIFTESIPKSAAGKILRKDLKAMYKNDKKQP